MPELRWALAALGALFLAGLAWWELRRARQRVRGEIQPGTREARPQFSAPPIVHREPSLTLPEIRAREPMHELPAVEVVDDEALIGLRADDEGARREGPDGADPEGADRVQSADRLQSADRVEETLEPDEEVEPIVPPPAPPAPLQSVLGQASATTHAGPVDPVVEWPEESGRRLVALRLVAAGERFSGRAVRQALAAEGFVLGKFAIFHRCGPDGRAVVSAANLTNPGTFDLDSIDMQRFGGLNLFAVLPGPLPPVRAFDQLVASARNLSERLQGALQDETGEPLTPLRAAAIRELLEDEN